MTALDKLMSELHGSNPASASPVRRTDDTEEEQGLPDVDALFGQTPTYLTLQKEKPEHRLMLWLKLQGHSNTEIAKQMGYSVGVVCRIVRVPWFMEAFCRLSTEMGKDAVTTLLEGEVIDSVKKLAELRDTGESHAVRLAAANSILDRVRGKPTQRVETKSTSAVDVTVYDAAKLLDEQKRNAEILRGRGIN